jgi:hypothetical protein
VKLRLFIAGLSLLIIGGVVGWAGGYYWAQQTRKSESMLALDQANTAAKNGDLDTAIQYATHSHALYPDSPLAGLMVRELTEKRAAKTAACPQK